MDGVDNQDVVDVETGVTIVERQETVDGELRAEVVVLATEHLLTHTRSELGLEVQNRSETEITTLSALVVLGVLDAATAADGRHTGEDILVQMETLLRLRHTATRRHERRVEEIGVTVVQLSADPREDARRERTERLLLSGRDVTEDTDVLREDVLARADDGDRELGELLLAPLRVRTLARDVVLLELAKYVPDLDTLLQVVVLVGINELQELAAVEDDRVVLVVRLAVTEDRVTRELDAELGLPLPGLLVDLRVTVDEDREETRVAALGSRLFVEVRDLEVGVRAEQEFGVLNLLLVELGVTLHRDGKLELPARHTLELALKAVRVASEALHNLRVLDAVEELDGLGVVHHAGNGTVQRLCTQGSPDTGTESVLGRSRLETDAVEGKVVHALVARFLVHALRAIERHGLRLLREDLGVLDEVVPLDRVQLLQVLKQGDTGVLVLLLDDLAKR